MTRAVRIVRCRELPAGFEEMLAEATAEGFSFVGRLHREWESGVNRFGAAGEAFFAACEASALAGVCGLSVDPYAGDPRVGRVRHLYVLPCHRGRGAGAALVRAVVAEATAHFSLLRLRTRQAAPFYEQLGFSRADGGEATHALRLYGAA